MDGTFEASDRFLFFDYFRVPYVVRPGRPSAEGGSLHSFGRLSFSGGNGARRTLYWPRSDSWPVPGSLAPGTYHLDGITFHARLLPDRAPDSWLPDTGAPWRALASVCDGQGQPVARVWHDGNGNLVLPFDPAEAITACWAERYRTAGDSIAGWSRQMALRSYYRLRPALPRPVQLRLRQAYSRVQARTTFPRWPVETALHDLYAVLFHWSTLLAGGPVPWIAPWPHGHRWALVLTHDVETAAGCRMLPVVRDLELGLGYRSAWNFVPGRYHVDDDLVAGLTEQGFEVGVHGLYHDGRDLESLAVLEERLPAIREYAGRWQAGGFRSPATHRVWEWMPRLGFDYDSSYPDTDPFEPQPGGCCSWLPFFNGDLVELPITLPQDHTLFVILRRDDAGLWIDKAEHLRRAGGMTLVITHPDYAEPRSLQAYHDLLERFADDGTAWRALPREVSAWWRRRNQSELQRSTAGWRVTGPAAGDAAVAWAEPA